MAMTTRERYLAATIGVVAGLFGLQFGINGLRSKLDSMQANIDSASSKIDDKNTIIFEGDIAARKLTRLQAKSLPTSPGDAKQQYSSWLVDIAKQVGMQDVVIAEPLSIGTGAAKAYSQYQFTLTGKCRIDEVVRLLSFYYDKDYLHSISALKFLPPNKDDPNFVSFNLTSQVIALKNAAVDQKPSDKPSGRLAKSVDQYLASIGGRNPFAPTNNPPQFSGKSAVEIEREKSFTLKLEGSDPDKAQKVLFDILSEKPEGLNFDPKTGTLDWRPKSNGEHELLVRVFDSGIPSKSIEQKIKLTVVDPKVPPPPPQKFDLASQTEVSALLSGRGGTMAMIRSKMDGKMFEVREGDNIEIGSIKAKVVSLNSQKNTLELETNGKRWTVGMDVSLADAYKKIQ